MTLTTNDLIAALQVAYTLLDASVPEEDRRFETLIHEARERTGSMMPAAELADVAEQLVNFGIRTRGTAPPMFRPRNDRA